MTDTPMPERDALAMAKVIVETTRATAANGNRPSRALIDAINELVPGGIR